MSALGRVLGDRFELLRRIGGGGAGAVFAARDHERGQVVALKRLRDVDPRGVYRFKKEFRSVADISHPNLVTLHELFIDGMDFFLSMELVEGLPLASFLRQGVETPTPESLQGPLTELQELPLPLTRRLVALGDSLPATPPEWLAAEAGLAPGEKLLPVDAGAARPPESVELDWELVRRTFVQLAEGVMALHAARMLHRDLKPSNVLVTSACRVVVLDFGLVTEVDPVGLSSISTHSIVGTPLYMAPEQCMGKRPGEASDWYSVGVMLYEVLAGRLPYLGRNIAALLWAKLRGGAPALSVCNPAVPGDLDALCQDLLEIDPSKRPSGAEVRRRFGAAASLWVETEAPRDGVARERRLVGRDAELQALRAAYVARGRVLVQVEGASGIGKSTLLESFLAQVAREENCLVLSGRCYQQEFLPYKTIDSVVDALSEQLARWPLDVVERLLPTDILDLARVFPVLEQVPAIRARAAATLAADDPIAAKRRAFAALRTLLDRIARERPLVVVIDDVHWGDLESAGVLHDLLRPPDAPPLLLVLAFRSEERNTASFLTALRARFEDGRMRIDQRSLPLEPLTLEACEDLVALLRPDAGPDSIRRIARGAYGHPFFLEELARYARFADEPWIEAELPADTLDGGEGRILLAGVIRRRVEALPAGLRALLEVIAVAGMPVAPPTAFRAAGFPGVDRTALQRLIGGHLLRAQTGAGRDGVAPYHDRIREAVLAMLPDERRRALHAALGQALLEAGHAPPHVLLAHFEGAGDLRAAARNAVAAAEQADKALAFQEAAELYRKALEWDPGTPENARRLRTRHADALVNQGRCREAAAEYLEAARDAPAAEASALRTRAAMSFMTCGAVEDGEPLFRDALSEVGVGYPTTRTGAALRNAIAIGRVRLRGIGYRRRSEAEIDPALLRRIDTCYTAARAFILHDFARSTVFLGSGLLAALRAGEPSRLVYGSSQIGALVSAFRWKSAEPMLALAEQIAAELDTPFAHGVSHLSRALALNMHDDWVPGLHHAEQACRYLSRCPDVTTVQQFARIHMTTQLRLLERFEELERRTDELGREGRLLRNPYTEAAASIESAFAVLARDDLAGARQRAGEALARAAPDDMYVANSALTLHVRCDLYEGRWLSAHERVDRQWHPLRRSGLLALPMAREFYNGLRAGAALEVAARDPRRRSAARRTARRAIRNLSGVHTDFGRACRAALQATVAAQDARTQQALALCREAAEHFERAALPIRAAAIRRRAAGLQSPADAKALLEQADASMRSHGVHDPARWTASIAPGFPVASAVP